MKAAILCAGGLGDGLLMMITAHNLRKEGREVTVFHDLHGQLSPLFPGATLSPYPKDLITDLQHFDEVIVQNDNSARAWKIMKHRAQLKNCTFFYPTRSQMAQEGDYTFAKKTPIGASIARATASLLSSETASMDNGILIPSGTKRKHKTRIAIHPTSADPKRNWKPKQFLRLARRLERKGYEIAFIMSETERDNWLFVRDYGFELPRFSSLLETAAYIYESGYLIGNDSGLGHFASNLGISTLTISGNPKRVALWRPSFSHGRVVTLPFDLPNFKGINFRFRENFWQHFIPVRKVYQQFLELTHET